MATFTEIFADVQKQLLLRQKNRNEEKFESDLDSEIASRNLLKKIDKDYNSSNLWITITIIKHKLDIKAVVCHWFNTDLSKLVFIVRPPWLFISIRTDYWLCSFIRCLPRATISVTVTESVTFYIFVTTLHLYFLYEYEKFQKSRNEILKISVFISKNFGSITYYLYYRVKIC